MTNASSFQGLKRVNKLRAILPVVTILIIISFFVVGGCNNSDSNQVDARTIGEIDGAVVPALKQVLTLRNWKEGDPDGDLYLNGSRVATLTTAEQQAVNDAYQMGYIVALVNPDIDDILDMHEVLGRDPIFADNGTLDLLAFSREFNVSGIRYLILRPYQSHDGSPIPEDTNLDRVVALGDWAQISSSSVSTAQLELREAGAPSELTELADTKSISEIGVWPAAPSPEQPGFTPDLEVSYTGTFKAWSVHSTADNNDYYYIRMSYVLSPKSTLGSLDSVCNVPVCSQYNPPDFNCPGTGPEATQRGVIQYTLNSTVPTFKSPTMSVIKFNPPTTTGEVTTSNSLQHTFSENVSYSQDEGAEVGVSSSSTYSQSTSYTSPSVTTTAMINIGPNLNNAEWVWFVGDSNVSKGTFGPNSQWIWIANPSTRAAGSITVEQGFDWFSYPYSCAPLKTSTFIPVLKYQLAIPPLPKDCSTNQDCGVGQVCATDLSPAICVAQPCGGSEACPAGFQCMNDECQPSS